MDTPLKDVIAAARSLEPFPNVALRVLELSNGQDVVPADLIDIIQTDPGLTGKVLKLCNSAFYGYQREIASLLEAGNRLGLDTLVNLVLTTCTSRYFRNYGGQRGEDQDHLWKNCITNAISSRLLAQVSGKVEAERAYTAGLLQNIGHLILDRFLKGARGAVLEQVQTTACSVLEAEKRVLGLHHAEIGARLASYWGLPEVLVDTIRYHHNPRSAIIDPSLAGTVHLAECLTWAVGMADGLEELAYEVNTAALELTGIKKSAFPDLEIRLRAELERASDLIAA